MTCESGCRCWRHTKAQYCLSGHDRTQPGALSVDGHCRVCALKNARDRYKFKKYGLSDEDYGLLLNAQGGKCALCNELPEKREHFVVDHDHETGVVRGLLHNRCNLGLGGLQDSRELLASGLDYLSRGGRLEAVAWLDASFQIDEGNSDPNTLIRTVGWVTRDGRWLRIVGERATDHSLERSVTRVPIELVVERRPLHEDDGPLS